MRQDARPGRVAPSRSTPDAQRDAARALEGGGVLVLPQLAFALSADERRFLSPRWSDGRAKNISLDGDSLKGARGTAADLVALTAMVARFAANAAELVAALFPRYAPYVKRARTSFRPQPAVGRAVSWRKDDSRLHVDAFPSRPNRRRAHPARVLQRQSDRGPRVARRRAVRGDGEDAAAARSPRAAGRRSAARRRCTSPRACAASTTI